MGWDYNIYKGSPALQKKYIEQAKLPVDENHCVSFKDVIENVSMMTLINKMIQKEIQRVEEAQNALIKAKEIVEELKEIEEKGEG